MCWNAEVSLNTFMITSFGLFILYLLNYEKFYLAFVFSYVIMQLIEYFIWIYFDNKNILRIFGFLTFVLIFLQPIIMLSFTKHKWLIKYYIILIILWFIFCFIQGNLKFSFIPYVAKNKHLSWNWTNNQLFINGFFIIYLIFLFGIAFVYVNNVIFIIGFITLLYSWYNYSKYKTISSMWCWMVNFFTIILIIHAIFNIYIPKSYITYILDNSIYDMIYKK